MTLVVRPYLAHDIEGVRAFNRRLAVGGIEFQFPETHISRDFPPLHGRLISQEHFVAVDETGAVRGAYILKTEPFWIEGREQLVCNFQLPLSEGIIDKKWAMAGVRLLTDALKRNPLLYCLGMGGTARALPQMLARFGWDLLEVPFYFRVLQGTNFARELQAVGGPTASALRLAARMGLASMGTKGWNLWSRIRAPSRSRRNDVEIVEEYSLEVDANRIALLKDISCAAVRSSATLAERFLKDDKRFLRLVLRGPHAQVEGWALVGLSQLKNHKQFGDMRLGSIIDGMASEGAEAALIQECLRVLGDLGADLVVSNQTNRRWCTALEDNFFVSGPSNFALARSPKLAALAPDSSRLHFTRGDGDGPINL
jgi:hypothetical protein